MRSFFIMLLLASSLPAAEPVWRPLVDEETLLVATAPIDDQAWSRWLDAVGSDFALATQMTRGALADLKRLGATDAAVVLGVSDLQRLDGPVAAIGFKPGSDLTQAGKAVRQLIALLESAYLREDTVQTLVADNTLLIGTRGATIRYSGKYGHKSSNPRDDFAEAIATLDSNSAKLVLSPGPDTRRVLRELWPPQPKPWEGATGPLLADGMEFGAVALPLGGAPAVRIDLAGADKASAQSLEQLADRAIAAGIDRLTEVSPDFAPLAFAVTQALHPVREGERVSLVIASDNPIIDRLMKQALPKVAADLSERVYSHHRMQQMKQLALALLNHESAHGSLPAADAIRDQGGKPLLSWRVAVLPFLEAGGVYDQFRLDEPWDSPHNLTLVNKMPAVFADPARPDLARQGLTTYQAPVGPETLFLPAGQTGKRVERGVVFGEGTEYRDITDGTSNTLMLAEVSAEHAVPWTKPADWEVDLADPLAKLRQAGRKAFHAAWADGSGHRIQATVNPDEFVKVLTRAGEEVVDLHNW